MKEENLSKAREILRERGLSEDAADALMTAVAAHIEGLLSSDLRDEYGSKPYEAMWEYAADMAVDMLPLMKEWPQ